MRQYAAGRWCELPVTEDGVIDLSALEDALNERRPGLVCVMAANNETGAVQPWRDALELCRESGVPFHVDAAQWLGKRPLAELAAAPSLTGCAHKCGGPKGVGFWRIPEGAAGAKIFLGGEQQHGHRAGTEDYPGAAGMLAAIRAREAEMGTVRQSWLKGRNRFEQRLRETIPGVIFACADADRLENTSLVLLPRHRNTRWVAQLDKRGFAVSTGSACATAKDGPSHVLGAQGVSAEGAERAVRVSALWSTTDDDWQALADAFSDVWGTLEAEATTSAVIEI
ncbi:MAG: cysteine desulfurase family protein, partial [Opitutales bacterium]